MVTISNISITGSTLKINYKGGEPGPSPKNIWDGWTTTTDDPADTDNRFCSGKNYPLPSEIINNPDKWGKTTGTAALPWSWICKVFKNKDGYCSNYIKGTGENNGPSKEGKCLLLQLINKYPNELKDINDPYFKDKYNFGTENPYAVSIQSDNIRAKFKDSNGQLKNIPTYKIFLINGCGGFCRGNSPDCFNSCSDGSIHTDCIFNKCDGCFGCESNKILQNNDWTLNSQEEYNEYLKYSYPIEVSNFSDKDLTNYGKNFTTNSTNTCSGYGMNLDIIGEEGYLWKDYIVDNPVDQVKEGLIAARCDKNITSCTNKNIFARYKWVPCNTDPSYYD